VNALIDRNSQIVIGHRGNAAHAPENTIESFDQAVALGADALELDVRVSRDGVPVVIHDPTLARTAGRPGTVAALSAVELATADTGATFTRDGGATFPYRGRGLTVPTLEAVLQRFPRIPLLIEVKVPEAVSAVERALEADGAESRVVAASLSDAAVAPLRGGRFSTGASAIDVIRLLPSALLGRGPAELPYRALCIPRWYYGIPLPVVRLARAGRRAGVVTHVWTVDDPRIAKRLWKAGIQGIVTNDPAVMLRTRDEMLRRTRVP
jgi:glycerophosphoryl diester phosphodiesterase